MFPVQSGQRKSGPLVPYQLHCTKAPLNDEYGPPDYFPVQPGCVEAQLGAQVLQWGFKDSQAALGITEAQEVSLSFGKLWTPANAEKARQSVWHHLRSIQSQQDAKRKASEAFGQPLPHDQPTLGRGSVPELRQVSDEARQQWLQSLASSVPLCQMAGDVPNGLYKGPLFDALYQHRVATSRACWLIKIVYVNRIRPDKAAGGNACVNQRSVAYSQHLRDHLESCMVPLLTQQAVKPAGQNVAGSAGSEAASKWQYMLRISGASYREGLICLQTLADWLLRSLLAALQATATGAARISSLLPLLQLCLRELALSQQLVQRMAAELRTDVQARVLAYTDADAMAVIQDGLAVGSSPATLEALSGLVAKGVPPTQTTQETVRLVCDWAASLPAAALFASSSASVSGPAVLEQATQQSVRRLWAGCLLRALEHQLSIGQHGSMGMAQGSKAPVGSPPALQSAIFTWLDTRSPPAAAGEERQALSLLLYLVEDSLFCPATYLRLLVARGSLGWVTNGAPADPDDRALLRHIVSLRTWEQCCLARWLATEAHTLGPTAQRLGTCSSSPTWWLRWLAENGAGSPPSVAEVITSAPPARLVAEAQQLCTSLQDAPSTDVNRPVSQAVASALTSWVTDPAAKPDPAPQSADPQLEAASQDLRLEAAVQAALTAAALPVLQDACSGSAGSAALVAAAQLCANPTLTATLLSRPQALYKQLLQGPHQQPGIPASQCTALPARLTVASLLQGQLQPRKDVAAGLAANQAFVARLLDTLTPAVCGPYWLALRTALDEQIMLAALQRGSSAEEARARARSAFQEAQQGKLAEQDKAFTSQVLAQLLVRPQAAPSYSKLAWQLGRGVGEYLLQQVDWILLDPDTLLGHKTLAQALQRRCLVDVQSDAGLVALDHPGSEPAPFAVEAALSQVALSGLAASQAVRQREFAEHVVNQLQRLADILKQHAADSMGGKPAGTRQVSQPPAAASTAGEVGTPGSPPDPKRRRSTGSFGAFGSFGKRKFGAAADITALTPGADCRLLARLAARRAGGSPARDWRV
ncbi:hypothetical protein WJX72_000476 [[Myrmecia] bisecta]|uniref:Mediator complex subunit Med12 domain-containing protein n=1 Tax=[Myrmecia] bisecta TaxID=41462 RepID=A0AAW1QNY4_9CHLO